MFLKKLFLGTLLLTLLASTANAYTLVMRDGRRVEIPDTFTVTSATLTYEVGSGIQITIQMSGVDIAATERVNGQPRGSLLQRTSAATVDPQPTQRPRTARRSITNKDLEVYKQARLQSELAYEKRRKQLGLPSLEVQRLENAAIVERTQQQLRSMRSEEMDAEQYWRERATGLRTEIASNQAQIDFVRQRLSELPSDSSLGTFSSSVPYGVFGNPFIQSPFTNLLTPNVYSSSVVSNGRYTSNVGFRTARSTFPLINQPGRYNRFNGGYRGQYRGYGGRGGYGLYGGGTLFATPYQTYDYSLERAELTNDLNALEKDRAGMGARWRALEEEARRAGAYPGWLRP